MADPKLGREKHHASNQISVHRGEIEEYLEKGFLLRMKGDRSGNVNLISPAQIRKVVSS